MSIFILLSYIYTYTAVYTYVYLFIIYLFGGYGPAGRMRVARDAGDVVPPTEVVSWDAARPRDADPPPGCRSPTRIRASGCRMAV